MENEPSVEGVTHEGGGSSTKPKKVRVLKSGESIHTCGLYEVFAEIKTKLEFITDVELSFLGGLFSCKYGFLMGSTINCDIIHRMHGSISVLAGFQFSISPPPPSARKNGLELERLGNNRLGRGHF
nr:hypothetical protein Iba_chr10eCG11250 [Ipomoea batatas]